ncbi:NAD(P)-dependent alcohol dehydrogenase [Nocardia sp. 348MFTsu5.1]|uniref:zinc-dependent alcohol dehydrogenase family protein n=1 Tax=Nocardia sp. 348MFTsu5.1 TaxID=1172185 RepID=UPI0003AA7272|nr:NAD(P)-dependent alcohol dehydrogenase [Nocardia sp. 348MFTsu5.1]
MEAVRLTSHSGYDSLALKEEAIPEPGRYDVVIRVQAASLNYRDTIITKGLYGGPVKALGVPLSDGAGEVAAVGSDVTRVAVGDRVVANCHATWISGPVLPEYHATSVGMTIDGMLAQYTVLPETGLIPIPDYMSYVEAASLPCAAVSAWSALNISEPLTPGQTVLVQGTGGVALFGLQIARAFGARVLAITSSDAKARTLTDLGAESVVNYRTHPEWSTKILKLTAGVGVDKVVEIGGAGTIRQSVACARIGGEIGIVGFVAQGSGGLTSDAVLARSLHLQGMTIGSRRNFEALLNAMSAGQIHPVIDSVYPFAEYKEAYRHLESGQHIGKIVISIE